MHFLDNVVVQEALDEYAKKAYVATNTEWMKSAALGAFLRCKYNRYKSSTP